jgi:glycosyltransferase involved in cell wall biosynthesis
MRFDCITPIILTFNEAENISRVLNALSWAKSILVIDSFSTDATLSILAADSRVQVLQRAFDTAANQGNFGLAHVGTEWVLSMDADYVCTETLIREIAELSETSDVQGYSIPFRYCIGGRPLRGTLYPPRTSLYRRSRAKYIDDGHTQRVVIDGAVKCLHSFMLHDDRKPLDRWLNSQRRYADREALKLSTAQGSLRFTDRVRKARWIAPLIMPFYCLLGRGLLLDGRAGLFYSMQRTYAEVLLALRLLDSELNPEVARNEQKTTART